MKRLRVTVALVTALTLAAGACSGASGDSAEGGSGGLNRNATLRFGWTIGAVPFDPHTSTATKGAFPYLSLVYDRLTQVVATPDGPQVTPMVATSWEFSNNGTVLTFQLRDDVTFHDGSPLTAKAVQLSIQRALTLDGSTVANKLAAIDRVEVVDQYTVRMHLTRPANDLPYTLATTAGAIVNPKAIRNNVDLAQNPAGSGPYELVNLRLGDRAVYERYDNYWDPKAAKVARIEIIGITEDTARLNALRSGQIDAMLASIGQYDQVSQLAEGDQYDLASSAARSWYALFLNTSRPPLDKVKVRQALNYAVNRQVINETVLNGQCQPTSQPLQQGVTGHAPSAEGAYTYNPAKARRLLAQAGVGDGFTFEIFYGAGMSPQSALGPILQAQLGKVGIKVKIRTMEFLRAVTVFGRKGGADSLMTVHAAAAKPGATLRDAYLKSFNFPGPLPDGYEQLVSKALNPTLDEAARTQVLQRASKTASQQALDLFLCTFSTTFAHASDVVGLDQMAAPVQGGPFDLRYVGITNK